MMTSQTFEISCCFRQYWKVGQWTWLCACSKQNLFQSYACCSGGTLLWISPFDQFCV